MEVLLARLSSWGGKCSFIIIAYTLKKVGFVACSSTLDEKQNNLWLFFSFFPSAIEFFITLSIKTDKIGQEGEKN